MRQEIFILTLGYNLVSTRRLADSGIESHFHGRDVVLKPDQNKCTIGYKCRDPDSRMSVLRLPRSLVLSVLVSVSGDLENELWHIRLANVNSHDLRFV